MAKGYPQKAKGQKKGLDMSGKEHNEEFILVHLKKINELADVLLILGGTLGRGESNHQDREIMAMKIREAAAEIMAASNSLLMTRRFLIRKPARV